MKDKYDEAVEYLTANPKEIKNAWIWPLGHDAGRLFAPVSNNGFGNVESPSGSWCGCLTQIRESRFYSAWTPELTEAIRLDERIPTNPNNITVAHLPIFAEWQRRIDKELNRV